MDPMGYEPPAKKNITTNPKAVLRQGSVHNQPKTRHYYRGAPSKNYPTFALLDPPKVGNLMTPVSL